MANGLSVRLPLTLDANDGIKLNKTLIEVSRQNFINLLFTIPGERIMIPDFGVGLPTFLFENDDDILRQNIDARIRSQTLKYLSYINIININFTGARDNGDIDRNFMKMRIEYEISPLQFVENIAISPNFDTKLLNVEVVTDAEIIPFI